MNNEKYEELREESEIILFQKNKIKFINKILNDLVYQWNLPLSIISTASTGIKLKKELNLLDDKELISSMELINKSVKELSVSMDRFRNFLDSEGNNISKSFYISELFEEIFKLLSVKSFSKNIELKKEIQNIEITTNENKLFKVLISILNICIDSLITDENINKKNISIKAYEKDNYLIIELLNYIKLFEEEAIKELYNFTNDNMTESFKIDLFLNIRTIQKYLKGDIIISNEKFAEEGNILEGTNFLIKLKI